ncbi:hypothetical protein [Altererythrobacter fulvus]|uniref:hypothetical protein n=1 Tax=Caenibius fulvus TaxID=2126012 RepID=UPI003015A5AF
MGLSIFLGGLAAVSLTAQSPQVELRSVVVQRHKPAAVPTFQLPEGVRADVLPSPVAARQSVAYPRIAGPEAVDKPAALPSLDWDKGNAALKMRVMGLHLGWNF